MDIVLADDSELILKRLKELLQVHKDIRIVGSFRNGTETFESIIRNNPDLVIIDVELPGLSGLEVVRKVRAVNKSVKIIVLTLFSSDYYRDRALKLGANYFFSKIDQFEKVFPVIEGMIIETKK